MFVRLVSDLHNEIFHTLVDADTEIYEMPEDKETTLILAGDICGFGKEISYMPFFEKVCNRFKHVVYVAGNHEYYGQSISNASVKFETNIKNLNLTNLHFLNPGFVIIDNVLFVGGTLWTDYEKMNPLAIMNCENGLNDFRTIRIGNTNEPYKRKVRATDFFRLHCEDRAFILKTLQEYKDNAVITKRVVVTHHGPTWESIDDAYRGSKINGAYVSDMTEYIGDLWPDVWAHGHIHNSKDYTVGTGRVLANPRGYIQPIRFGTFGDKDKVRKHGRENLNYDALFRIELL